MVIVDQLRAGPKRYTQLEGSCSGISPRTLSTRLHEMAAAGLVTRQQYAESPPRVDYELTDLGRELIPAVEALRIFGGQLLEAEKAAGTSTA